VLDEKGEMIGLDVQLAIAIDYILEKTKAKAVVCTVESSLLIKDIVKKHNAKLFLTPVGSRNVAIKMRQTNAVFGGEPCGEYIFKNALSSPDGLATSLLFAEIFSKKESLHNLKKIYKTYPIKRLKISCQKNQKSLFMKKLEKNWPFKTKLKIDGLMAQEDWGWVLVRPSGTENFIRITIEAYTQKDLDQNLKKLEEVINE
jgi:phosphoglucosamine mutase